MLGINNSKKVAKYLWRKKEIVAGAIIGASIGVATGGVGIVAMGTALGVSGPVAGSVIGVSAVSIGKIVTE